MPKQNPEEMEPMTFDDDLLDADQPESEFENLLADVPKPMANYLRATRVALNEFTKPPSLPAGIIIPAAFNARPVFIAQVYDAQNRLDRDSIHSLLTDGWRIDGVHQINDQALVVWIKMELPQAEDVNGETGDN
jgi:hypothetical protein